MMTCFNDSKLCMVWGVGFLSKDGRWMLFSSLRLQSALFQRNVFLNLGIMILNLSEKIYVLFYPCLFPAVFEIPIDLKAPCLNYGGYDRFSFFLHFFNLYNVDFGG